MTDKTAYKGSIFYFKDTETIANLPINKDRQPTRECQYVYIEDGVLIVEQGLIIDVGSYADLKNKLTDVPVVDYSGKLISPGFIDTHQHASQSAIVAAYGDKLLEWIIMYFPQKVPTVMMPALKKTCNFFSINC